MSKRYNAAQWDGNRWQVKRISIVFRGNLVTVPLYEILAFSSKQMWLIGDVAIFGDGSSWTPYDVRQLTGYDSLLVTRCWGTDPSHVFFVGLRGSLVGYTGVSWQKLQGESTVDFQDIWGLDANHIWATGTNTGDGHSVVLQFNGSSWTTIYDNATKPAFQREYFNTLWTSDFNRLYLDGGSYMHIMNLSDGTMQRTDSLSRNQVFRIRGTHQNDIFRVGYGGEVVHYNGASWFLYPGLKTLNGGTAWFYSVSPTQNMVVIGGLFPIPLNGYPIVIRGVR